MLKKKKKCFFFFYKPLFTVWVFNPNGIIIEFVFLTAYLIVISIFICLSQNNISFR